MNFTKTTLSALTIASALFMANAQASVIKTAVIAPASDFSIGNQDVASYTFDMASYSYVLDKTTYDSGILSIRLTDKAGTESGYITFGSQKLTFGNLTKETNNTAGGDIFTLKLNAANLDDLNKDGKIAFSVTGTGGDFYFASATLAATDANAVPEPLSLGLLGIGFLGLGAARCRKAAK
ncbi:MAG: PEP-CTERM sorting domain-containing protein [Pseudomonadota bacterium]|nr:PEP-CTERM sorting domain-containing protein [Pseudomonadota bacterium]